MQKLQPRRSWVRRHPILTIVLAIPILFFCVLFLSMGITQAQLFARGQHIAGARTPQELAAAATLNGQSVTVDGDLNGGFVTIKETVTSTLSNYYYRLDVVQDCFYLQSAFWQRYPQMKYLDVEVNGPASGGKNTVYMGNCLMERANAINQPWNEIDAQSAWAIYNEEDFALIIAK